MPAPLAYAGVIAKPASVSAANLAWSVASVVTSW